MLSLRRNPAAVDVGVLEADAAPLSGAQLASPRIFGAVVCVRSGDRRADSG
ncbi:hypothetical protein [Mycobacterium sp.]|uniref:hypothetical protein n=1 Tax=Mycobacterium sp. TaxID=1785 RepID=UPI0025DCEAE6|nr:hypothetical protein [Mycobacterium sp.]